MKRNIPRILFPSQQTKKIQKNGEYIRFMCYQNTLYKGKEVLFSVVVPKKYYKTTVERNLFKRRIKAVLLNNTKQLNFLPYNMFVVFPLSPLRGISFQRIEKDLIGILNGLC